MVRNTLSKIYIFGYEFIMRKISYRKAKLRRITIVVFFFWGHQKAHSRKEKERKHCHNFFSCKKLYSLKNFFAHIKIFKQSEHST